MRGFLMSLVLAGAFAIAAPAAPSASVAAATPTISAIAPVFALQVPDQKIEVTVGERGGSVRWYRNPVWVALGVLAVIIILLLVVIAARGGGTTVIRD
jgi:hypothetical protein